MLLFSTLLNINDTLTKEAFVRLVIEWNQKSPYASNVIDGIEWTGEMNVRYGDERLWLAVEEYRNEDIVAVRHEKHADDGAVWDTDFVMNFRTLQMAIRLDRSYTAAALTLDQGFSTPHFITLLIEQGYLRDDHGLAVLREPTEIDGSNIGLLADVICERAHYDLPVVYVSKTFHNEDPVDVGFLASRLKGVAHVLVEQNEWLNQKIRTQCHDRNEYFGAIGVYYPTRSGGHRRYLYRRDEGPDDFLMEKVVRTVVQYGNAQLVDTLFTWQGVRNAVLRDRLTSQVEGRQAAEAAHKVAEAARKEAEARAALLVDQFSEQERKIRQQAHEDAKREADELLDQFEDDMRDLRDRIDALTRRNEALEAENQGLKAKLDATDAQPVLYAGDEHDLYPGEVKDLLLSTLVQAQNSIAEGTRRADVVRDVVESNGYERLSEAKAERAKLVLRSYRDLGAKERSELRELGFEITEEGKHYKLTYFGDGRYQVTCAKTPSDVRSGKNAAQQLVSKVY